MSGDPGTESDIDMEFSAESSPRSSHREDCNPEHIIDVEIGSERVSSPNSQVEDDSASGSETSSEAEIEQKTHRSNPSKSSSNSGQDLCPVEIPAHAHKSSLQSDHIEDFPPEPGTEAKYESKRVLSPNTELEDDSSFVFGAVLERVSSSISQLKDGSGSSETVTGLEAELTQEPHLAHPVNLPSPSKQNRCPIERPAQAQNSPPQSNQIEDYAPELRTEAKDRTEPISSTNSHLDNGPDLEFGTRPKAEIHQKQHSQPFSQPRQDLCPIETPAHSHSSTLSSSSISIASNNNVTALKAEVLAYPDHSAIEIQYTQLMQPTAKNLQTLVLPHHYRTSPRSRHAEQDPTPDILTALERYLDDLDALSIEVPADAYT